MTPLRKRMLEDMQLRNLAPATQGNDILHVARFAKHSGKRPDLLSLEDAGPLQQLSADYLARLLRSRIVAARRVAPLSCKRFRRSAWLGRISPLGWSLLSGAPALTRRGLAPAGRSRISGRAMDRTIGRGRLLGVTPVRSYSRVYQQGNFQLMYGFHG